MITEVCLEFWRILTNSIDNTVVWEKITVLLYREVYLWGVLGIGVEYSWMVDRAIYQEEKTRFTQKPWNHQEIADIHHSTAKWTLEGEHWTLFSKEIVMSTAFIHHVQIVQCVLCSVQSAVCNDVVQRQCFCHMASIPSKGDWENILHGLRFPNAQDCNSNYLALLQWTFWSKFNWDLIHFYKQCSWEYYKKIPHMEDTDYFDRWG